MSIQKRVRGGRTSYRVRWLDEDRQRSKTFSGPGAQQDARAWDAEVTRRKRLGTLADLDGGKQTLGHFIAAHWGPDRARDLAPATRVAYDSLWRVHIEPTFGGTRLRDITAPKVAAWRAHREDDGAGTKALREAHSLLGGILGHACELGELQYNAARAVRPRRRKKPPPVRPLPASEVEQIRRGLRAGDGARAHHMRPADRGAAAVTDHRDAALVSVLAYAGLRPAEALALRWADLGQATLLVARACDLTTGKVKETKTDTPGVVKLLAPVVADLAEWSLACGRPPATAAIFPTVDGQPWSKSNWQNWRDRQWRRALARADLPHDTRPYDLRHSFASLLLAEGRSVHYVAKQLRNSPEQVLRTYGHVIDEYEDRVNVSAEDEIRKARGITQTEGQEADHA